MHIQISHNEDVTADESLRGRLEGELRDHLGHYERQLTTVLVNLMDMNARSGGPGDRRVSIEARPNGHPAVAVHHEATTWEDAVRGGARKLERRLEATLGRRSDVKGGATIRGTGPA